MTRWTEGEKVRPDLQMVTPNMLASSRRLLTLKKEWEKVESRQMVEKIEQSICFATAGTEGLLGLYI